MSILGVTGPQARLELLLPRERENKKVYIRKVVKYMDRMKVLPPVRLQPTPLLSATHRERKKKE